MSANKLTLAERRLRARAAAYRLHSLYDSPQLTANARAGSRTASPAKSTPTGYCPRRNASVEPSPPARPTTSL